MKPRGLVYISETYIYKDRFFKVSNRLSEHSYQMQ